MAPLSSIPTAPQPIPLVVEIPYTIIDGPPVIQIPPATSSDRSLPPPNTPPPLVPANPQIAMQHLQRQRINNRNLLANTDVNDNIPTRQPADLSFPDRPLSSSSLFSLDAPNELINTPASFPSESEMYPNQICVATDEQQTQPSGIHGLWLLGDNSLDAFNGDFSKEMTTLSPTSADFSRRFTDFYESPSAIPSSYYPTPFPTSAQYFPQHGQAPETPAQLYTNGFKPRVPSPHDTFAGYSEPYISPIHTRSDSLPNLPFQGTSLPGMADTWNYVTNGVSSTDWISANQQRPWA